MAEVAILLGAGASCPYGTPSFGEFRKAAEATVKDDEALLGLLTLWKQNYGDIDLEEFHSLLQVQEYVNADIQYAGSVATHRAEVTSLKESALISHDTRHLNFRRMRREVLRLIPWVLYARTNPGKSMVYDELVERISEVEASSPSDVPWYATDIISFNWDTLFEAAADSKSIPTRYAFEKTPRGRYIAVHKPHGSISWEFCTQCEIKKVFRADVLDRYGVIEPPEPNECTKCGSPMEHLLLAPTFVKRAESDVPLQLQVLHKGVLRSVYSAIKTCSHLYIVGYRFPMTDYEFYLAFRSAVRTNESLRRIVVVNKPKPPSEMVQFVVHFQSLLERTGKEDLLEFDFGGVEEWVKKPLLL